MSSLTRSASLTDLISGNANNSDESDEERGRHDDQRYSYVSPERKIQQQPRQQQQQPKPLNILGGSASSNWNWLTTASKSFHGTPPTPTGQSSGDTNSASTSLPQDPNSYQKLMYQYQYQRHRAERQRVERSRYMDHLETLLGEYCSRLSHPTYQNAAKAMSLLLESPPPPPPEPMKVSETSPVHSPQKPSKHRFLLQQKKKETDTMSSVKSEMNRLLSSPFRVRKRRQKPHQKSMDRVLSANSRWNSLSSADSSGGGAAPSSTSLPDTESSSSKPQSATTSKLDEAGWQEFCTPLILLAGAEAVYADLEHVHPSPNTIHWSGLYSRVASDLLNLLPIQEETPSPQKMQSAHPQTSEVHSSDTPQHSPSIASPPRIQPQSSPQFPHKRASIVASPPTSPSIKMPVSAAAAADASSRIVAKKHPELRSLCNWLDFKCQWIPFHESLYLTWSADNLMFLRAFSSAQMPTEGEVDDDESTAIPASRPLMEALQQEILATKSLLEMAFWLERGRFLETVVNAQKVKKHISALGDKETALVLWMKTTFQDYLSMMPLVFDRIATFATPLYGFDQQILLEATQRERTYMNDSKGVVDLDNLVVEFLRRQEKAGGTATAVAIVLNTEGLMDDDEDRQVPQPGMTPQLLKATSQSSKPPPHVEFGFAVHKISRQPFVNNSVTSDREGSGEFPSSQKSSSEAKLWPPIYLRSSTRLNHQTRGNAVSNTAAGAFGIINGMRKNAPSMNRGSAGAIEASQTSLHSSTGIHSNSSRASWSSDVPGVSPRSKYRRSPSSTRSLLVHGNVFEYEADSGSVSSWPHSEWPQLRALLETMNHGAGADVEVVTDQPPASPNHPSSPSRPSETAVKRMSNLDDQHAAFTFHPDGVDPSNGEGLGTFTAQPPPPEVSSGSLFGATEFPRPPWDPRSSSVLPLGVSLLANNSNSAPTTFHAAHLSNFMWMVVMVKGEEESRWHRRRTRGLPDEEIRAFLNDMASKLRISNRFLGLKTCQTARVMVKDPLAPRVRGRDLGLRDAQWKSINPEDEDQVQEEVLQLMKDAFGVAGMSPILNRAESILTNMGAGFRKAGHSRSPRDRRRYLALQKMSGPYAQSSDYREGAALLFLGPELFRQFLESTNE